MKEEKFSLDSNTEEELRDYNLPLYGIQGQFSLTPGVTVPYFTTLMSIRRVTSELKTHEEVAPSMDNRYTLEELFQRQIDTNRVRTDIVDGYLKSHNKLKFFNSITVALFPKDLQGNIAPTFEEYSNNDPRIPVEAAGSFDNSFASSNCSRIVFGGVQFVKAQAANLARLRWDKERVDAVAVDGQHRLHAIKQWFTDKKELTDVEKPTRISVIFLLLHEKAGFERADSDSLGNIKGIAREIFTDLNKNAKEVDLATQIVLDDRSLESRCVRSLITSSTCADSPSLLPLSLLRWREANNRFDQKYFLNSLINLHLIVKDLIGLSLPLDPMNAREVKKYIKTLETCLGDEGDGCRSLCVEGKSLMSYYESDYFDAGSDDTETPIRPFIGIPPVFLPAAVAGFQVHYAPWMLSILRGFQPYRELLDYAKSEDLIEGQFSQFQSQPESARSELQNLLKSEHGEQWHEKIIGRHERHIQKIKGIGDNSLGDQWAFKTIFQKAFLRLGKQLVLNSTDEEKERMGTIADLISFMDSLYQRNILRVCAPLPGNNHLFWTFIAINYGNRKIKVSTQTERKIGDVLLLVYTGWRYAIHRKLEISNTISESTISPRAVFKEISPKNAHTMWGAHDAATSLLNLMRDNATIISPSLGEAETNETIPMADLEKEKNKIARNRVVDLLATCWIGTSQSNEPSAQDCSACDHEMI